MARLALKGAKAGMDSGVVVLVGERRDPQMAGCMRSRLTHIIAPSSRLLHWRQHGHHLNSDRMGL